jgi:hypothetical protein
MKNKTFFEALMICLSIALIKGNNELHSKLFQRILSSPNNTLLPYGSSFGDKIVPYGDDVSFGPIKLKEGLNLNAIFYHELFISTNGFVSFEHSDLFEAVDMSLIEKPQVAVLFSDFDTKRSGSIFYKELLDADTLDFISSILESDLVNSTQNEGVSLTSAFVVTWVNVPLYGEDNSNSRNTFQLILGTEANCSSYAIFYYKQIDVLSNFTIGLTSGEDGLFEKQVDRDEFLNLMKLESPVRFSFRLSELESSCARNDEYDIYPYGISSGDKKLPRGDDISYGPISLESEISFYEKSYTSLYISTNGYVSFEFNEIFEPVPMGLVDKPTIACLFDDFDTKRKGNVFYRQTQNKRFLRSISNSIKKSPINEKPELDNAILVTWSQVPTYGIENSQTESTFQLVLVSANNEQSLFGIFIYANVSLGTLTNFSVGLTNGKELFTDMDKSTIGSKSIVKLFFKVSPETSSSTETTVSSTESTPMETSTSIETSASASKDTSTTETSTSTETSTETIQTSDSSTPPETTTSPIEASTSIETSSSTEASTETSTTTETSTETSTSTSIDTSTSTETSTETSTSIETSSSTETPTSTKSAPIETSASTIIETSTETSSITGRIFF